MTLWHRLGAVGFGAAAIATGTAAPAAAIDPPADGYYTFTQAALPQAKWEMQSVCIQANGTRLQSDYSDPTIQALGCGVNLGSSTPSRLTREEQLVNFNGRAALTNDLWSFTVKLPAGMVCPDGSTAPTTDTFAFSEVTLAGTHTTVWDAQCGKQPGMTKAPFTLSFDGPLNPPVVDRFPDNCNYLAGRPSICS